MIMKRFPLYAAVLGILIGVFSVLTVQSITERGRNVRTRSDWYKLNYVLGQIEQNYVDTVDRKDITDKALSAVLQSLDPHSMYMPPVVLEEVEGDLASNFDGIGIQFNVPNDTATVIEVIPGGPSEKIGLLPGDRILKVDSCSVAGVHFPQDSIVRRIKGPSGTKVLITVRRDGQTIPFEITRGSIPIHCVDAFFMLNDTTGYIRLGKFTRTTFLEVHDAATELREAGMKHLVFDLRENSGGYFDQALMLGNMFLPKGSKIVYMEGNHRKREDYYADGRGDFTDIGLSVIIDENTASSSEIFAGAVQDNSRGRIVGRRSFGKGLVQEPIYFTDGSGIRLTVARFYTPSGRCIQKAYSDDYNYEIYYRYNDGEMFDADSMKVEKGGIVPDVFVPVDTTKAGKFYIAVNKKATTMRYASAYFDTHKKELGAIDDYDSLLRYLDRAGLESGFLRYALEKDGLKPDPAEWEIDKPYIMTQVRALVGRYSALGDNAFYHLYMPIDTMVPAAIGQ